MTPDKEKIRVFYTKLHRVWIRIVLTGPIYIAISLIFEMLPLWRNRLPLIRDNVLDLLRYTVAGISVVVVLVGFYLKRTRFSNEALLKNASVFDVVIARYIRKHIILYSLWEVPALMGLALTLMGKNIFDVIILGAVTFILHFLHRPSLAAMNELKNTFDSHHPPEEN